MNQMAANASEEVVKEKPFFNTGGNLTGMVSMKVSAEFLKRKKWNALCHRHNITIS